MFTFFHIIISLILLSLVLIIVINKETLPVG
jgi:hypothetical protein